LTPPARVSVVVPCFNLGELVGEAIDSVLAQTFDDVEIVIVDDGSTDDATRRALAGLDRPKTRVVRSPNRGLSAARNLGIRESVGAYVCSLDADDRLTPECLERGVELLDAEPDVAFVTHWLETFGDEHWTWRPTRCDLGALLDLNMVNGAALVRREVVDAVGGFDESMREGCEDWEFWIRVTERGYQGVILPEVLYLYRRRPDSMSRTMNESDVHLRLYAELVHKHPASYRRHLPDLLLRRERTIGDLHSRIDSLRQELDGYLEPALAQRRRELAVARERREVAARRALLTAEVDRLRWEVSEHSQRADWLDREREGLLEDRRGLHARIDDLTREAAEQARRAEEHVRLAEERGRSADERGRRAEEEARRADQQIRRADEEARRADEEARRADEQARLAAEQRTAVADLRASWSWRLTAPLRRLADWVGFRGARR
jgi:glycosyltransferase involved in cell wall biosynthesis